MSDNPAAPLLGEDSRTSEDEPSSSQRPKIGSPSHSKQSVRSAGSDESTPLLSRPDVGAYNGDRGEDGTETERPATSSVHSIDGALPKKSWLKSRWPTVVALTILILAVITILVLGFATPAIVEEYAKEAAVFEPTELSFVSITSEGVEARVQGDFRLDSSRVSKKPVRDLGRAATWIANEIEVNLSKLRVNLPEYGNSLLGTADVPPIVVSIRDGVVTHIDFFTELKPGEFDGIRQIANDWVHGDLDHLSVTGTADVGLKSGIFSLGTQTMSHELFFQSNEIPSVPNYNITKFDVHDVKNDNHIVGIGADVMISAFNEYPISFTIPPLGFHVLVPGCFNDDDKILLANAMTDKIDIRPKTGVDVSAQGIMHRVPERILTVCPGSQSSPLDRLLASYISGLETTVFVRGADSPYDGTPQWISDLIKTVVIPVAFTGHSFKNIIREFSLTNVHFSMPSETAEPFSPSAQPKVSATIKVVANIPKELKFSIDVPHIKATSDILYKGKKFGELNLREWQDSSAERLDGDGDQGLIVVNSEIKNAPINITDESIFAHVLQSMIFGGEPVLLEVKALVDIETSTALGIFAVHKIPAGGEIPIKPLGGDELKGLDFSIGNLDLLDTTKTTLSLGLTINATNPTNYSASVPFFDVQILCNDTVLGHATVKDVEVVPGMNKNISVIITWDPIGESGQLGANVSREMISEYISGYNTTLIVRAHKNSVPSAPAIGSALSALEFELPTPKLKRPKNPNKPDDDPEKDKGPRFIDDATMHILSSTATFTLLSPLRHTTLYLTFINATAFYQHVKPVAVITYDEPIAIEPGASQSPALPVEWSLKEGGLDIVKDALGGTLKLDAHADVGVRVGEWEEKVWFQGRGIGAHVKL